MAKTKISFFCTSCGNESAKWLGRCPACNEWNTYKEEKFTKPTAKHSGNSTERTPQKPQLIQDIETGTTQRISSIDPEFNRVLGGGVVPGSVILLGGEPGIGKSTLLLQIALSLTGHTVLYSSGEESMEQIKMRADRMKAANGKCFILSETNTEKILREADELKPSLLIVDSIQTCFSDLSESAPGSYSQLRDSTALFQRYAKEKNVPVLIIGHINKEGDIAGPKLLEHIVDVVLQFEGDRNYTYRMLRTIKNRFGSTAELGIYEMESTGLRPVLNPSEILISQREENLSGIALGSIMEGMRPMMVEAQGLVSPAVYGTPQRSATGYDLRRMNMLLAVLEKRIGLKLGIKDVFLNIAGGIRVADPALDLSVLAALISSYEDTAIPNHIVFSGEVGLSGEIRAVNRIEQRIGEAAKLGFKEIYISKFNKRPNVKSDIKIKEVGHVYELFKTLF